MRKNRLMFKSLALVLAMVLPLLGLTFAGCTAQDAVDLAAVVAEAALEALEETPAPSEEAAAEEFSDAAEEPEEILPEESAPEPEAVTEEELSPEEPESVPEPAPEPEPEVPAIDENGSYDDKDNVALYLYTYGRLPSNYITKAEAQDLGWEGGSVERFAPGKCIGGMKFGNYEGLLPKKSGRQYYECDIDTLGESSRGAKRIVYSNDGLIYYTDDHYESFTLLYGEE